VVYYIGTVPTDLDPASYPLPQRCPCCRAVLWNPSATWYGWRHGTGLTTDDTLKGNLWCTDCETDRKKAETTRPEANAIFELPGPLDRDTWTRIPVAFICATCGNLVVEVVQGANPGNLLCCGNNMNSYTGAIPPPTGNFWNCAVCGEVVELRTVPIVGTLICCGQNMVPGLP
jgi:hypothetical protein